MNRAAVVLHQGVAVPQWLVLTGLLVLATVSGWTGHHLATRRSLHGTGTARLCASAGTGTATSWSSTAGHNKVRLGSRGDWQAMEALYQRQRAAAEALLAKDWSSFGTAEKPHRAQLADAWGAVAGFYPCPLKERLGGAADGGKWLCSLDALLAPKPACTVFSLGSAGQVEFEVDLRARLPGCAIHVFDPTLKEGQRQAVLAVEGVTLHEEAIGAEVAAEHTIHTNRNTTAKVAMVTIDAAMEREGLGWVDIIKMDIEGYEYEALRDYVEGRRPLNATFFLVEVHLAPGNPSYSKEKRTADLLWLCNDLMARGFRIFSQEPNLYVEELFENLKSIQYSELAFINVDDEGFVNVGPPA